MLKSKQNIAIITTIALGMAAAAPAVAEVSSDMFVTGQSASAHLTSNLVGAKVYNSASDQAEVIGDINDVVFDSDGQIEALVIGVGGFVGIAEKSVAVQYDAFSISEMKDGDPRIVFEATKADLEAAPAFDGESMDWSSIIENRDMMQIVVMKDLTTETLAGARVYTMDDEWIGEIDQAITDVNGMIDAVVVDYGGWLGIGEKEVAVGPDRLQFMTSTDESGGEPTLVVYVDATKDEFEAAKTYDAEGYSADPKSYEISSL